MSENQEAMTPAGMPRATTEVAGELFGALMSQSINLEEHLMEAQQNAARLGYQNRNMRSELEALYEGHLEKERRITDLNALLHEAWEILANGAADPSLPTPQHSVWGARRNAWRDKWFRLNGVTVEEAHDTAARYAAHAETMTYGQQPEGSPEGLMDRPDVLPTSAPSQA